MSNIMFIWPWHKQPSTGFDFEPIYFFLPYFAVPWSHSVLRQHLICAVCTVFSGARLASNGALALLLL